MTSPIQYMLRNVPEPVDRYLRTKARISGESLNQVIIDELAEKIVSADSKASQAFSWFIGSGIDEATLDALDDEDKAQKLLAAGELAGQ